MGNLKVSFKAAAAAPDRRPFLPRSGASAAPLPTWHPHEVILVGGYTEDRGGAGAGAAAKAGKGPWPPSSSSSSLPPPHRAPTIEAWTFSSDDGGRWHPVSYAEDSALPQPRLTSQAALVGDELWLVGGWDPSAAPGAAHFLNDVWALDLRTYRWRKVDVAGEDMPRISRFAMAPLPDGRLMLHTHRCDDHVLLLDPRVAARPRPAGAREAAREQAVLSKIGVRGPEPGSPSPPSRGLHSLTAAAPPQSPQQQPQLLQPGGAMYVYGGAPQTGPMYGDLWVLDTAAMTWRRLDPAGQRPQARCSHVAVACGAPGELDGRYLMIIGGSFYTGTGQLEPLDDVVLYDTQTNRWLQAEVEGQRPSPRNAAVMVPLRRASGSSGEYDADTFVLYGGWRPFVETYNDTYIVTITHTGPGA